MIGSIYVGRNGLSAKGSVSQSPQDRALKRVMEATYELVLRKEQDKDRRVKRRHLRRSNHKMGHASTLSESSASG